MSDMTTSQSTRYDSAQSGQTENERHSLQTYLSDALALERHIAQPLGRQLEMDDTAKYSDALRLVQRIKGLTDAHISALEAQLTTLGGHPGAPVKEAWSQLLGGAAAALDGVRKTKVSKNLRDDHTALSLATISYTMLHATAMGLGDTTTAAIAKQLLTDYAQVLMDISHTMPVVVLQELRDDGENVSVTAAQVTQDAQHDAWSPKASQQSSSTI